MWSSECPTLRAELTLTVIATLNGWTSVSLGRPVSGEPDALGGTFLSKMKARVSDTDTCSRPLSLPLYVQQTLTFQ